MQQNKTKIMYLINPTDFSVMGPASIDDLGKDGYLSAIMRGYDMPKMVLASFGFQLPSSSPHISEDEKTDYDTGVSFILNFDGEGQDDPEKLFCVTHAVHESNKNLPHVETFYFGNYSDAMKSFLNKIDKAMGVLPIHKL